MDGIISKRTYLDIKRARDNLASTGVIARTDIEYMESLIGSKVVTDILPLNMFTSNATKVGLEDAMNLIDKGIADIELNNLIDKDAIVRKAADVDNLCKNLRELLSKLETTKDSKYRKEYESYLLPKELRYSILQSSVKKDEEVVNEDEKEDNVVTDISVNDVYGINIYNFLFDRSNMEVDNHPNAVINRIASYEGKGDMLEGLTSLSESIKVMRDDLSITTDAPVIQSLPLLTAVLTNKFTEDIIDKDSVEPVNCLYQLTNIQLSSELLTYKDAIAKLAVTDFQSISNNVETLEALVKSLIEEKVLGKKESELGTFGITNFESLYHELEKVCALLADKESLLVLEAVYLLFKGDC